MKKIQGKQKQVLTLFLTIILLFNITPYSYGQSNKKPVTKTITGTIEGLNFKENSITILDYGGKRHNIKIQPSTIIEIEGMWKDIKDLYFGQEIDINLENNIAKKIVGYPEEDPERHGYIMPGTRFRMGTILFISQNQIEIKGKNGREKYRLTPATHVIKNGSTIGLFQVKIGDKVVLNFDDIYSTEVSTLRVQDEEKHIEGILRGKLHLVDERKKEILLKSPYIYKEGKGWTIYPEHTVKLKTNGEEIYHKGEKIGLKELKKHQNQEAYIAFDKAYGNMNIAKLQTKNGSLKIYQGPVGDIEYGREKMVVNKKLIHFNLGTIVIKDNRLVDTLNIDKSKDVFVNTDTVQGNTFANFVSIEGSSILDDRIDDTKIVIYRGKIEDIYEYGIKIGKINYRLNHLKLMTNNKWTEIKDSERFELTEDTFIYDSQLKKIVPTNYFISSRYINLKDIKDITLRNRVKDNFYKGKTAYFIVKETPFGKEVLALNLTPNINEYRQNINTNYSTIGEIEDIDYDKGTITFTKVKNFNTLNNRFENADDEIIDINTGVILLNDIPVPQDKLYILKKRTKAYIIKYNRTSTSSGHVILLEE